MSREATALGIALAPMIGVAAAWFDGPAAPAHRPLAETQAVEWAPTADWRSAGPYLLADDLRARTARWTLEFSTGPRSTGTDERRDGLRWVPDWKLPAECRATLGDYDDSGFDRGHLVPAASMRTGMPLTFRLSNAMPQVPALNRGRWRVLEEHVRQLEANARAAVVITVPLYLADADGQVRIRTIGDSQVWVPTHCGKAILYHTTQGDWRVSAWIMINADVDGPLQDAAVTVDDFERRAGLDLWRLLPDELEADLEAQDPLRPVAEPPAP